MRKVPLGTHYTALGSHPDVPRPVLMPSWLASIFFVSFMVVLLFSVNDHGVTDKESNFYKGLTMITMSLYFIVDSKYNWKRLSRFYRWLVVFPAAILLYGLYLSLLKP